MLTRTWQQCMKNHRWRVIVSDYRFLRYSEKKWCRRRIKCPRFNTVINRTKHFWAGIFVNKTAQPDQPMEPEDEFNVVSRSTIERMKVSFLINCLTHRVVDRTRLTLVHVCNCLPRIIFLGSLGYQCCIIVIRNIKKQVVKQ